MGLRPRMKKGELLGNLLPANKRDRRSQSPFPLRCSPVLIKYVNYVIITGNHIKY